jgi:hypothetical protein
MSETFPCAGCHVEFTTETLSRNDGYCKRCSKRGNMREIVAKLPCISPNDSLRVWKKYHGDKSIGHCAACNTLIRRENRGNKVDGWHAKYNRTETAGGTAVFSNMRVACKKCSRRCGCEIWDNFVARVRIENELPPLDDVRESSKQIDLVGQSVNRGYESDAGEDDFDEGVEDNKVESKNTSTRKTVEKKQAPLDKSSDTIITMMSKEVGDIVVNSLIMNAYMAAVQGNISAYVKTKDGRTMKISLEMLDG